MTLASAAAACNIKEFNWQQTINSFPRPSIHCTPDTCLATFANPTVYLGAPPDLPDPYPNGGWAYEKKVNPVLFSNGDFDYPFYYGLTNGELLSHETASQPGGVFDTLSFSDTAADPDLLNSEVQYGPDLMMFTTSLVGVTQGNQLGPIYYTWTWTSDFDGTVGGLLSTKNDLPADPGSGTGGVTIKSINGTQLPTAVSASQIATTASGLAYSRVTQTFNGTVTLTNISSSAISGPFQIVFFGMPANVTLVNATSNLSGTSYLTVPAVATLTPGQSVTVSVQFKNPANAPINLTPAIYSGGSIN
jgi:hypothetical protein